ncbi:MAG: hypoxanthine phosphoribosyltransferase [Clostridiales bacterium]|jgi:hypoxanthine phosphoribosyltransferase|nr:hypoxanthine phosphoribosyltransferase [Clostridiales bacterium]
MTTSIDNDIGEVIFTTDEISAAVKRLAAQINRDYKDKNLLLVSVLKGAVVFLSDLMREINISCSIDFMAVSSYGKHQESSGIVKITKDLDINLTGYDVLLVEDILDSGNTLQYLTVLLESRKPASLKVCTLLDKPERREALVVPDYIGLKVPNSFIVGYGLDYYEKYRNLPYIGVLKREVYEKLSE